MTQLRKRMLEELQRRKYSPTTIRAYLYLSKSSARYFRKSPDKLDQEQLRQITQEGSDFPVSRLYIQLVDFHSRWEHVVTSGMRHIEARAKLTLSV